MLLTAQQFIRAIPALEEADKALTQMSYRDLVATAQANVFFTMGIRNPDLMKAGYMSYAKSLSGFHADMSDIVAKYQAGRVGMPKAMKMFKDVCGTRYQQAFRAGTMAVGNPYFEKIGLTRKDMAFISHARRVEMGHFRKFLVDIKNPAHIPRHPYMKRAGYYAESGKALFFDGQVSGAGTEMIIRWVLGVPMTKSCSVCPVYAQTIWTWQTLPTVPGAGGTPCGSKCLCYLEHQQKTTGKHFDFAGRGSAEALTAPGRQARVFDSTGKEVGGMLQDEFELYYARMYKARQMIHATTGADRMAWIRTRKEINQLVIDRMKARGLRVTPTIAVKDLTAAIEAAMKKGGMLVDDFAMLGVGDEVVLLRGDYSSVGRLVMKRNQMVFQSPSGVELPITAETDVMFLLKRSGWDVSNMIGGKGLLPVEDWLVSEYKELLKRLPTKHMGKVRNFYVSTIEEMKKAYPVAGGGKWRDDVMAFYDPGTHNIYIKKGFGKHNAFHEVGHAVDWGWNYTPGSRFWEGVWKRARIGKGKYPSKYSLSSPSEFFAECYANYMEASLGDVVKLKTISKEVIKWFDEAFGMSVGGS